MMIPEPKAEEIIDVAGREEPAYKPPPTTQEGLRKQAERQDRRKEELEVAFALNWATAEPATVERVVEGCWKPEDTGGNELWDQCERIRDLILKDQMPQYTFEDRERLQDNANQLIARGDWQMDPGTTYHRRIKTKISPKCGVPTEDVFAYYSRIWNPDPTPENTFVPAAKDSPWFIDPPQTEDLSLDLSFQEHMMIQGQRIKKCLNAKHNLSALGLDGVGYYHSTTTILCEGHSTTNWAYHDSV
jgi:hypothetical protein